MPKGCNCQGQTKPCTGGGAMVFATPPPTTTMPAPAQPPIPPPPPPVPLPGPPPPLPLAPAKPLPGLPGLPGIDTGLLPTLGPPPLWKMTPAPTLPPPVTTPPPPTTPGPTTPAWVETPYGLIAGTTPNPWLQFTTTQPATTVPPPEVTGFLAVTLLSAAVNPGTKILMVEDQASFTVGAQVMIDEGTDRAEINKIVGFGSMIMETPLVFPHDVGCNVTMARKELNATAFAAFKNATAERAKAITDAEHAVSDKAKENLEAAKETERERILAEAAAEREKMEAAEKAAKEKAGAALVQADTKGPMSFLYRSFNRFTQQHFSGEQDPCNCPCTDMPMQLPMQFAVQNPVQQNYMSSAAGVDQAFDSIMNSNSVPYR